MSQEFIRDYNRPWCICGCGQRANQRHHVVYQQHLRRAAHSVQRIETHSGDERNLVPIAYACHGAHHGRSKPLSLDVLPDSVFSFAAEVLGAGAAYEYLRRRYSGDDARLEALLEDVAA